MWGLKKQQHLFDNLLLHSFVWVDDKVGFSFNIPLCYVWRLCFLDHGSRNMDIVGTCFLSHSFHKKSKKYGLQILTEETKRPTVIIIQFLDQCYCSMFVSYSTAVLVVSKTWAEKYLKKKGFSWFDTFTIKSMGKNSAVFTSNKTKCKYVIL